jgi:hypothetical protein
VSKDEEIRERHEIEDRATAFFCRDINGAINYLYWKLGDKHLNPLVHEDRAYLLECIAELEAKLAAIAGWYECNRLRLFDVNDDELRAILAKCQKEQGDE